MSTEVTRYLWKLVLEPRCEPPGLKLGTIDALSGNVLNFEDCSRSERRCRQGSSSSGGLRVYIFEEFAAMIEPRDPAPPQLCSEKDFHHVLAANSTGLITNDPARAHLFYVPYYAGCLSRDDLRREASSGLLMRKYKAALHKLPQWQRYGGANSFSYTQRHFTERVSYGIPIRDLMKEVPLTWLSPEITVIKAEEIIDGTSAWMLSRVVLVPQPPVLSRIIRLNQNQIKAQRTFRFSLVGGIINAERRRLTQAIRMRQDAFVRLSCREGRFEAISMVRSPSRSSFKPQLDTIRCLRLEFFAGLLPVKALLRLFPDLYFIRTLRVFMQQRISALFRRGTRSAHDEHLMLYGWVACPL